MILVRIAELRHILSAVPEPTIVDPPAVREAIAHSAAYLASDAALASLAEDVYWPKWDSPWWHMLLLWELGEAARISERAVAAMVSALDALPLHHFPISDADWPAGANRHRDSACHCALGCIAQVLASCGVDVDRALPWVTPWFARYQMPDGGLSCDEEAYLVPDECPSSMVGTVAAFEAMEARGRADAFVDRAAEFLVARELRHGSTTAHNADERSAAAGWLAPCFPRFYFYDVLRGATALVRWATRARRRVPLAAIDAVAAHLATRFPDGIVRVERRPFARCTTWGRDGAWDQRQPATTFPLLDATSALDVPSAALTREWSATRRAWVALIDAGLVTEG